MRLAKGNILYFRMKMKIKNSAVANNDVNLLYLPIISQELFPFIPLFLGIHFRGNHPPGHNLIFSSLFILCQLILLCGYNLACLITLKFTILVGQWSP